MYCIIRAKCAPNATAQISAQEMKGLRRNEAAMEGLAGIAKL
ncbi:MAG: hypothetical protein ABI921_06885 [Panacibacter sp.]